MLKRRNKFNEPEKYADVMEENNNVFIFEKLESGISLTKILDLKGYLVESEARAVLEKLAFVLRLVYNSGTHTKNFDCSKIQI